MEEIEAAPSAWVRLMARKCWLMLWNTEVPNMKSFAFLQMDFFWLRVLPVRWFVLLMFAPAGIWAAAKWGNRGSLFVLLAFILLYSATNIIFFVCDRYRYPVWPAMAGIAAGGWSRWRKWCGIANGGAQFFWPRPARSWPSFLFTTGSARSFPVLPATTACARWPGSKKDISRKR